MRKVSFKILKNGTRYCPKAKSNPSVFVDKEDDESVFKPHHHQLFPARVQCDIDLSKKRSVVDLTEDDDDEDIEEIPDADVSFIVNIFPDGYTIEKTLESISAHQIASMYDPRLLRPYDRTSQSLFRSIKCCRVPVNFFEDIPYNYKNGKVACEVRDWRKNSSEQAGVSINGPPSVAATPSIRRIYLWMSVDSIVRDIPLMSKREVWPYSELLTTEAKILLALYPKLDLNPYPNFDRLCKKPTTVKLNLDFRAMRQKRMRQMSVPEKSNLETDQPNVANPATQNAGQKTAMGPSNSVKLASQNVHQLPTMQQLTQIVRQIPTTNLLTQNVGQRRAMDQPIIVNLATQNVDQCNTTVPSPINHASDTSIPKFSWVSHQPEDHFGVETSGNMQSHTPGTAFNAPGASSTHALVNLSSGNDGINSLMSAFESGRGNQDSRQSSSMANSYHRNRSDPLAFVGNQQQKIASHNALGASSCAPGASSTHAMESASSNHDRQSSFMANSKNRDWSGPLALIGNHQQMTLEIIDDTPGTAFNVLRDYDTRRRSFVSAFDGRTVNQDGQSSFPMAFLDDRRSRSNSLVFLGNQQQLQGSQMEYNNAQGASSSNGTMKLNSNNGGASSSSLVNMDNRNWSNPLVDVVNQHQLRPLHNQYTSGTIAFSAPGTSSTHVMTSLNSNYGGISSIIPLDDGKMGNQDDRSSFVANLDNQNHSNPFVYVGYQEPKIEPHMPDHAQRNTFGVPGASSTLSMIDLTTNNDDLSSIFFGSDNKGRSRDGQSSFMANVDNRNQSNPLAIIGNQQQQIVSQTVANVPEGSSTQGTVNLSSDDNIDIRAILSAIEGNDCSPMADNADNNQSNPLASVGFQHQQIAANQKHGMLSSGSDDGDLWSFMSAFDNKRGHQDGQSSSMAKRNRLNPSPYNGNQLQQMGGSSSQMNNSIAPDSRWKNTQQSNEGVIQQSNDIPPSRKQHHDQMLDAISSIPNTGPQLTSFPPLLTRTTFVQAPWNNKSPSPVNISVKEEPFEQTTSASSAIPGEFGDVGSSRRKRSVFASVPIDIINIDDDEPFPRRSSSRPPKSSESSGGAIRKKYRATSRSASVHAVGGSRSSSSTIGYTSGLSNVQRELDRRTQDRFTKIRLLTARYNLNCKEVKVDDYQPTINIPSRELNHAIINSNDNESILIDETCKMPFSMSHVGGNVNLCKTRILKFVKEAYFYHAGDEEIPVPKSETKLILSERESDGTVTMHYCEFDDYDHSAEELLPMFPNTHIADMFAAEFCSLMQREGYTNQGDYLQAKPVSMVLLSDAQCKRAFGPTVIAGKPYPVGTSNASRSSSKPGNGVGTVRNIGGGNSMVVGQGTGNMRRGAPRAGRRPGAAPSASGRSRGQSSNTGGSHGDNLQVPSGSDSGSRGRGSRGRGSRGRGSRGRGSNMAPDNNVNPRLRNDAGQQTKMALSKPSALGEFGEQSSNTGVVRIGNMNIDPSLISGSGGSGSCGLLVRSTSTSGTSTASDMNRMQRNAMALPRFMNKNQMQTNLQPASVSTSVNSGASRPSLSATNQSGASTSKDWIDFEFIRNLL